MTQPWKRVEIKHFTIRVGDQEIILSKGEAYELYEEMKELFDKNVELTYIPFKDQFQWEKPVPNQDKFFC